MKRRFTIAIAAALAAGGFSMCHVQSTWAEDAADKAGRAADNAADAVDNTAETAGNAAKGAADKVGDTVGRATGLKDDAKASDATADAAKPMLPAGVKMKETGDEDRMGVLKTLGTATQAAVTKDGFDDLVERLVDQDRNRLGKDGYTEKKFDDLNAKADAFQKAWKAKYGRDFKLQDQDSLAMVMTTSGEVEDPAALASAWPVAASADAGGEAVTAAAKDKAAAAPGTSDQNLDSNIEKGRDVAIAAIPASHGMPGVNVSLIQEAGGYRIDIPNTTTPQQLHDNVLKHLSHVMDMQADWPADQKEAEAIVAHHVLLGVYGIEADKSGADKAGKTGIDKATDDDTGSRTGTESDAATPDLKNAED